MSTYVISDIHGYQDKFNKMLEIINFSDEDTLYILGDVVDRGKYGIEILEYIMDQPNILMLKGNHEKMMEDSFHKSGIRIDNTTAEYDLWKYNGGRPTNKTLTYRRGNNQRYKIYQFIKKLPLFFDNVVVNGITYYLVHGKPVLITRKEYIEEYWSADILKGSFFYEEALVWGRVSKYEKFFPNKTVIFGHTITNEYQSFFPFKIWTSDDNKLIGIDCGCGCGPGVSNSRLGCLCLDTMEEFYI